MHDIYIRFVKFNGVQLVLYIDKVLAWRGIL